MEKLFKALPRDLQWHILTQFVGSHSVRKGKLIKKIVMDDRHQMVKDIFSIEPCSIWLYKTDFNAKTYTQMREGSQLMFCEHPVSGEMGYLFRKRMRREHSRMPKCWGREYTPMNNSVILPPFEKHSYPSYEDTDKKKEARHPHLRAKKPTKPRSSSPLGPPPPYHY